MELISFRINALVSPLQITYDYMDIQDELIVGRNHSFNSEELSIYSEVSGAKLQIAVIE